MHGNRNIKLISIIAGLLIFGFIITCAVDIYISKEKSLIQNNINDNEIGLIKLVEADEIKESDSDNTYTYDEFHNRINEIEEMLILMRKDNKDKSVSGLLSIAGTELRYWEIQLDVIYDTIIKRLPENEDAELAKSQQEWLIQRENVAKSKIEDRGSMVDSLKYTNILIEETKERISGLLEDYKSYIKE